MTAQQQFDLWAGLEEDAWKASVGASRRVPRIRFMRLWGLITNEANKDYICTEIQSFRSAQRTNRDRERLGQEPSVEDTAAVVAWVARAESTIAAKQNLSNCAENLSLARSLVVPGEDSDRTVAWLNGISMSALNIARDVQGRINDLEGRRDSPDMQGGEVFGDRMDIDQENGHAMPADDAHMKQDGDSSNLERDKRDRSGLSARWYKAKVDLGAVNDIWAPDLWVKQDSSGIIADRVVIKHEVLPKVVGASYGTQNYNRTRFDPMTSPPMPGEISTMLRLRPLKESNVIVKLRSWKLNHTDPTLAKYTLLLEYCGLSNLRTFAERYKSHSPRPAQRVDWIPEPFAWSVFEDLAVAGLLMERGDVDPGGSQWDTIVHRDLKGSNVFLSEERKTSRYRGYPTAKLGDFGLACSKISGPAADFCGSGTRGFLAPDQLNPNVGRLSTKTNVWGVGMVMQSLLASIKGTRLTSDAAKADPVESGKAPEFEDDVKRQYSPQLIGLIQKCTAYRPSKRPSFAEVLPEIRQLVSNGNLANGLREAPDNGTNFVLNVPDNTYALGLALRNIAGESAAPEPIPDDDDRSASEGTDELGGTAGEYHSDHFPEEESEDDVVG
ncbi:unnamed protein product [Zymoseptoria tritici ST99CH_3D1]|nr:unnamed protein product [Zymoseptoria tritici ST99CH_3D1]